MRNILQTSYMKQDLPLLLKAKQGIPIITNEL